MTQTSSQVHAFTDAPALPEDNPTITLTIPLKGLSLILDALGCLHNQTMNYMISQDPHLPEIETTLTSTIHGCESLKQHLTLELAQHKETS